MMRPWNKLSNETIWNPKKKREDYDRIAYFEVYNTRRWRLLRKQILSRHPLCVLCQAKGEVSYATVLDHIIAIQDGGSKWDENNLQPICFKCHTRKTNDEINNRKRNKKEK